MSGPSTDSTTPAPAAAAGSSTNADSIASFDGDMSAFGLPANFGGAAFSGGPAEGKPTGRGHARGPGRGRGRGRGGMGGGAPGPKTSSSSNLDADAGSMDQPSVPTGPRSHQDPTSASSAPPHDSGGFRGARGRGGSSRFLSDAQGRGRGRGGGHGGGGGPRGRGRGGGRGGFGGQGQGHGNGNGNGYGYAPPEKAPQVSHHTLQRTECTK